LLRQDRRAEAAEVAAAARAIGRQYAMKIIETDAWEIEAELEESDPSAIQRLREETGFRGPTRR
jgi:hypothetical protein